MRSDNNFWPTPAGQNAQTDEEFMRLALDLAARGEGLVEPNPMVGCVLVKQGKLIGRGFHRGFGLPHAEVDALRSVADSSDASGCTAYVTLEPCCHRGKTPPCTRALIDAKVARVVVATVDPFSQVDGNGISQLKSAGIQVDVGVLGSEARQVIAPFSKRVRSGLPWVIAKWAMTMDGRIATRTGSSQWITGAVARVEVHQLRSRVDAIVVGMGTLIADDPMLNARVDASTPTHVSDEPFPKRTATRVVMCGRRLPPRSSRLMQTCHRYPTLLVASPAVDQEELAELEKLGAEVFPIDLNAELPSAPQSPIEPFKNRSSSGSVLRRKDPVMQTLHFLADKGATNVMIEGGAEILSSFFEADQIDEAHVFVGSKLFGGTQARGPLGGLGVSIVADAKRFELRQLDRFDDDVRLIYRRMPPTD